MPYKNPQHKKLWYQANKEKSLAANRQWVKDNPEKSKEHKKKWEKNNPEYQKIKKRRSPEKYAAHTAVNNAVKIGKLTRQPCEVCGEPKTHGHHDDYTKPLEVRWLCQKHHREYHTDPKNQ